MNYAYYRVCDRFLIIFFIYVRVCVIFFLWVCVFIYLFLFCACACVYVRTCITPTQLTKDGSNFNEVLFREVISWVNLEDEDMVDPR